MGETFLGGVVSPDMGRLSNDSIRDQFTTRGYGLYFTDSRLVGVSYKKIAFRAYLPGYVIFLIWVTLLASVITYDRIAGIAGDQQIPFAFILGPSLLGLLVVGLVLFVYLSPRQAAIWMQRETITSLIGLVNKPKDLNLERANVSQISIQDRRISILMKSGEWYFLVSGFGQEFRQLMILVNSFCAQSPPISLSYKFRNTPWQTVSRKEIPS